MFKERINKTELQILKTVHVEASTVTSLTKKFGRSKSYMSECVSHLEQLGFISIGRQGNTSPLYIAQSSMGNELSKLLREEPALNLDKFLGGSGLKILPLILEPGYTAKEISERSGLSSRTVQTILGGWRQMGLAVLEKSVYKLNPRHRIILSFVEKYAEHRNLYHLKDRYPKGSIVWQHKDEYIFSTGNKITDKEYVPAANSRLAELNYDIIYRNEYYHFSPTITQISEIEALVQTMKFNMGNPRIKQFVNQKNLTKVAIKKEFIKYSDKYSIRKEIEAILHG